GKADTHETLRAHQFRDVERIARIVRALERILFEVRERETANRVGEGLLLFGEVELHLDTLRPDYSAFAPDALTIADHLVSSRSMSAAYSSGRRRERLGAVVGQPGLEIIGHH